MFEDHLLQIGEENNDSKNGMSRYQLKGNAIMSVESSS